MEIICELYAKPKIILAKDECGWITFEGMRPATDKTAEKPIHLQYYGNRLENAIEGAYRIAVLRNSRAGTLKTLLQAVEACQRAFIEQIGSVEAPLQNALKTLVSEPVSDKPKKTRKRRVI